MSNEKTLVRSHFPKGSALTIQYIEAVNHHGPSYYDDDGVFMYSDDLTPIEQVGALRFRWREEDGEPVLVCTTKYMGYYKLGKQAGDPHDVRIVLDGDVSLVESTDIAGGQHLRLKFTGKWESEFQELHRLHLSTDVNLDWATLYPYVRYPGRRWPGASLEMLSDGPGPGIMLTESGHRRMLELVKFITENPRT